MPNVSFRRAWLCAVSECRTFNVGVYCILHIVVMIPLMLVAGCGSESTQSSTHSPQGLYAGVAARELDIPVGVPQSGYGARYRKIPILSLILGGGGIHLPDSRESPYADGSFPTIGMYTRPNVKCLALEQYKGPSVDRIIICRTELAFVTDILRRRVVDIVEERSGLDIQRTLLLSATHTHSAGARFWRLPYFSDFASDTFQPEVFERIAWSIAQTILAALDAVEPAQIGMGIWRHFDSQDALFRDRRPANDLDDLLDNTTPWNVDADGRLMPDGMPDGKIKDDQLTILRVDRRDGRPLAVLFHFPVHSTTFGPENLFMSSDTSGAIEHWVELAFTAPVVAMHIQGAAGDIEPGLIEGHPPLLLEQQGRMAAHKIMGLYEKIPTTRELQAILSYSKDVRQDYDLVGYPGATPPYSDFDAHLGAAQCGVVFPECPFYCLSRPMDHLPPYCWAPLVGAVISKFLCHEMHVCSEDWAEEVILSLNPGGPPYEQPPEIFHIQHAVALLKGMPRVLYYPEQGSARDEIVDLLLLGFPGEPTTPFSWQSKGSLLTDLQKAGFGTGPDEILVCGYMQDYFGYLLTPEDWLAGGYEISINLWGPFWGQYISDHTRELARSLISGEEFVEDTSPHYDPVAMDIIRPMPSTTPAAITEPVDTHRFGTVLYTWRGGDPGVDRPRVYLQRQISPGVFETVTQINGRPYDDSGPEIVVYYRDNHVWSAYWETPWDFSKGTYRFFIDGKIYTEGSQGGEPPFFPAQPYTLISQPFLLSPPSPAPLSDIQWTAGLLSASLHYPAPSYDRDPNTPDGLRWRPLCPEHVSGTLTFVPVSTSPKDPIVVEGDFTLGDACTLNAAFDPSLTPSHYSLDISLGDAYGNSFHTSIPE